MKFIYILIDPRDQAVRYVGCTRNPYKRWICHISSSKNKKLSNSKWISDVLSFGLRPELIVVDEVITAGYYELETYWISQFKSWGFNLTNVTGGGKDGCGIPHYNKRH